MAQLERIKPVWAGDPCIVAAPGPSLTPDVAHRCRMARWIDKWHVICVQDAYRLMPWADVIYGCDPRWWDHHKDCNGFWGEKWSTHHDGECNNKLAQADAYGIKLVRGEDGNIFSTDPGVIRYGSNSGFQAINLAILKGCTRIVLVGFDMRSPGGKRHFFGDHPKGMNNRTRYEDFIPKFEVAARHMPRGVKIVNATPESALTCFSMAPLEEALAAHLSWPDCGVHRDRAESER